MFVYFLLVLIILAIFSVLGFVYHAPQFGAKPQGARLLKIEKSPNYHKGKFINLHPVKDKFSFPDYFKFFPKLIKGNPESSPDFILPVVKRSIKKMEDIPDTLTSITWFGHSAFFLKVEGVTILLDPMLGDVPAPAPFLGRSRFNRNLPIQIEDLPPIDAVLLSHDHYDHLDYGTIIRLKEKVAHYFVPLGLGAHLEKWGVPENKITETDWWDKTEFNGLTFVSTPAQHFSGRGLGDKMKTLWSSWVIIGQKSRIFFNGDSGYFDGYKEIGEKYGPFDITLMECGQYSELWAELHSFPEQTAQAHIDLKGKVLFPIHWGAFAMSTLHAWDEPVERISKIAAERNIKLTTPMIGEEVILNTYMPNSEWWINDKIHN